MSNNLVPILIAMIYNEDMAKRASQDIKNKTSRSRKTKKRLVAKKEMLKAKGAKPKRRRK